MRKNSYAMLMAMGLAALTAAGCGGGGGSAGSGVIELEPKSGGKLCVPKSAARTLSSSALRVMQGSFSSGTDSGYVMIDIYAYASAGGATETYFSFFAGTTNTRSCGELSLSGSGTFDTSTSTISGSMSGTDTCYSYTGSVTGAVSSTGASGDFSLTPSGATSTITGTWSAKDLNCVRIALGGQVAPNAVGVESLSSTDFDVLVYDLNCNTLPPVTATGTVTWTLSSSAVGSISADGVLTATGTTTTATATLSLNYGYSGLFTDSITVSASPGASLTAKTHADAAKNYLFKTSVTSADFAAAQSEVSQALAADPNSPDANLLKAIIDIGAEYERYESQVAFTSGTIFPYNVAYRTLNRTLGGAIAPLTGTIFNALPRVTRKFSSDDPPYNEYQTELETTSLNVISGIVSALVKVNTYAGANPTWTFSYLKDVSDSSLGYNYIDATDVKLLLGSAYLERGWAYYALAYDVSGFKGWIATDANGDGKISASEQFPNATAGTLRTNGATYLSSAKSDISTGLSMLYDAVVAILAEATPAAGGATIASTYLADATQYKHYLNEFAASFGGTATSISVPEMAECYKSSGGYYFWSSDIWDPAYNVSDTIGCTLLTRAPARTISMKLSGLFEPAVSDLRSLTPNIMTATDMIETSGGNPVFPDSTFNGIFPGGVQTSWFDESTADVSIYLELYDSTGAPISCASITSATITIGAKTLTQKYCIYNKSSTSQNTLGFYNLFEGTAPTSADQVTMNFLVGTQATVSVPGYQTVTLTLEDSRDIWTTITLTP
ncbi:MAG: hypothetical protein AB1742_13670 [bacterium]